ncbi:MAG: nucleotidyltransferase family protein [Hyphomicrobiales bacterium]|nr:nucleotidyltransferase family protein [Hyphomicrobiales bacterium]
MSDCAAIVLAAGKATRFSGGAEGATKLTARYKGAPLVRRAVETALAGGAAPVLVVTGHARQEVLAALAGLTFTEVFNPHYADGVATSICAGVAATPDGAQAALVMLADMPHVTPQLLRALMAAWRAAPQTDAVAPLVEGRRGNPVLIARRFFPTLARLRGDEGARRALAAPGVSVVEIEADEGSAFDVDTRQALEKLNRA